ncbi:MAG: DUF5337 family protein [Pseudomonadota bacterium]
MTPEETALRSQARIAAIVMGVTVLVWLGATYIGGQLGLLSRYAFLFDFAALAAFAWSVIVLVRVLIKLRD